MLQKEKNVEVENQNQKNKNMSKYNLTDILEQYRIGSGFTTDFDYEGMLKAGLETGVDTDIEKLKAIFEDFTDVNYHREAEHLSYAIDALEEGAIKEASMFFGDFHAEIKSTMETFDMEIPDTLGAFMASKMDVDESFDSLAKKLDKQKGITKKEADKIAGSIAAKKRAGAGKGPTAKQKKRMTEVRIDRDVAERIEGFLNIPMKAKFLNAFEDLIYDLLDDEPFYVDDVIAHLSNEMHKRINGNQVAGERLAGIEEAKPGYNEDGTPKSNDEMGDDEREDFYNDLDSIEEALPKFKGVPPMKDIVKALKNDAKATDSEIKQFMASVKKAGDEFDDVDDYVEDFKNYVADKSLQEHFGRFMKDYQ